MTVSVLIVDDHEVVRLGLTTVLQKRDDIDIIDSVATGSRAIATAKTREPDVVVMDVRLPDMSGIEACREVMSARPKTRVLMLTSYADEDAVMASILAGACGYLLKDTTGRELADAILRVASGDSMLDPTITGMVLGRIQATQGEMWVSLSERERMILELIGHGKTNKEIAEHLSLAEGTVRNLVSMVLSRLGAVSRADAAARFARQNPS